MAFCTFCGAQVPDDIKFCTGCGKPMPPQVKVQPPLQAQPQVQPQVQPQAPPQAPPQPQVQPHAQPQVQPQPVTPPPPPAYTAPASPQPQPQPAYAAPVPPPPQPQPVYAAPPVPPPVYAAPADPNAPLPPGSKYEPITTGGYIGIMLLMMLPLINFILLLVWACGGCRKVNKTNFARAMLVVMLAGMVLSGIAFLIFGSISGSLFGDVMDAMKAAE